jgi:hypothetical protein
MDQPSNCMKLCAPHGLYVQQTATTTVKANQLHDEAALPKHSTTEINTTTATSTQVSGSNKL